MTTEQIDAKKNLLIHFENGDNRVLTYSSIEKFFKETLKCNIFNVSFNICSNEHLNFPFEINCSINNYVSADYILENIGHAFYNYSIYKDTKKRVLFFNAKIRSSRHYENKVYDYIESLGELKNVGFCFFIKNIKIDNNKICLFLSNKLKNLVNEQYINVEIENFYNFKFSSNNIKTYVATYKELEEYFSKQ